MYIIKNAKNVEKNLELKEMMLNTVMILKKRIIKNGIKIYQKSKKLEEENNQRLVWEKLGKRGNKMTEGEKEAIEQFKSWRNYIIEHKETTKNAADLEFYIRTILNLITKLQKRNEELQKYDYRNIEIDKNNEIKSPSFTKEQLDLMNLGIALYIGIPKLLEDESEEVDIWMKKKRKLLNG